jgi:hypothetical protein
VLTGLKQFAACGQEGLIPTWYKYLDCDANSNFTINNLTDFWNIGWGVIEIILFIGSVLAVFFLVYGGIQYIISQGAPDKTAQARKTLSYAIAGLVIAIIGQAVVRFIGGQFGADVGV